VSVWEICLIENNILIWPVQPETFFPVLFVLTYKNLKGESE